MNVSEIVPARLFHIFPLHGIVEGACTCPQGVKCKDIGKHPLVSWRTYDESTKGPSGGYGIQTGRFNGIFVVDLDVKPEKGKDGIQAFTALAAGRPIPDTLSVLTPSGGVHLYFQLPPNIHVPKTLSVLGSGIDILGEGGYVVGPGSPHKLGGFYQEVPEVLADAPDWLLALVVKQPEPLRLITGTVPRATRSAPANAPEIAALLGEAWPASGRHPAQLALAGALCRDGWSEADAVEMLCAVCGAAGDEDRPKRVATCRDTWVKAAGGANFTGWKELGKFVGDKVVTKARKLLKSDAERAAAERFMQERASGVMMVPKLADPEHEYTFEIGSRTGVESHVASLGEICSDLLDHKDWAGVLQFDAFKDRIVAVNPPMPMDAETSGLSDADVQRVRMWFEHHGKKINREDISAAIDVAARKATFHSIQDMLTSVQWDGRPRLSRVLPDYFQTQDGPYELAVGPKWFIALVARATRPGCQSDCTLILEGAQGIGKTSAFRSLMRNPTWYAESSCGVDNKDFFQSLRGIWLLGFDELDSLTRASLSRVNAVLTATHDHYRKSYGRYAEDHPRSNGFCGTTNAAHYWHDTTGARRIWPVKVLRDIDTKKIERDRDQLWAEAYARLCSGEPWHVDTPELRALCENEQSERLETDTWEEIISKWLNDETRFSRKPVVSEPGGVFKGVAPFDGSKGFTTTDVLQHAIGKHNERQTRSDATRVGSILRGLEMKTIQARIPGGRERRYVFPTDK